MSIHIHGLHNQADNNRFQFRHIQIIDRAGNIEDFARYGGLMRNASRRLSLLLLFIFVNCAPSIALGQDRIRIGVPFFPTVSYPVYIAQERGFFEQNGLKG